VSGQKIKEPTNAYKKKKKKKKESCQKLKISNEKGFFLGHYFRLEFCLLNEGRPPSSKVHVMITGRAGFTFLEPLVNTIPVKDMQAFRSPQAVTSIVLLKADCTPESECERGGVYFFG